MAITNTSKQRQEDWLFGGNPNAIEAQEQYGQRELVKSSQLPAENNRSVSTVAEYEKLGIKVIGKSEGDELFVDVKLPEGWKIEATGHSMWSDLNNEKGEQVASIFYKAAFYDRRAHVCFV